VDVLLKLSKEDASDQYFAMQVKTYHEVDDRNSDLSKQLKAALFDADSKYGESLRRYYILLFGHAGKHSKRIAAIANEFANHRIARVIGPRDLLTFIELPNRTVSAIVDRYVSKEDYVRTEARAEVAGCTEPELYFLLACLCWAFENSRTHLPDDYFYHDSRMINLVAQYGQDALHSAMTRFEDAALEQHAEPASSKVRVELYPALRALYFDIQVRYGKESQELFWHLFEFLRPEAIESP
jgi:hypothetical protein